MEHCASPGSPLATVLIYVRRYAIPLFVLGLCCLIVHRLGVGIFLLAGFLAAPIVLVRVLRNGVIVPFFFGVQCPTCREWGLVRVACISFGYRFYRCDHCGQRCKRMDWESPWVDSSGMEDDDMYKVVPFFGPARKRESRICAAKALAPLAAFSSSPCWACFWEESERAMSGRWLQGSSSLQLPLR